MAKGVLVSIEGKSMRFPNHCANCLSEATERRMIMRSQSSGRRTTTRKIEIPYCAECLELVTYRHPREMVIKTLGVIVSILIGIVIAFLPRIFGWVGDLYALAAFLAAVLVAIGLYVFVFRRWGERFVDPEMREKRTAARKAIAIQKFSRKNTTFRILNRDWAKRFAEINNSAVQD